MIRNFTLPQKIDLKLIGTISLLLPFLMATSPQIPTSGSYASLSAEQQKSYEAAAFLLNLKQLGILTPNGPICAEVTPDQNGDPSFKFSVQGDAFETGSCAIKTGEADVSKNLQKLAKASAAFYHEVRGLKGPVPISVFGFSDGQKFSAVGPVAKQACPELEKAEANHGSYNLPLATTRANRVASELSSEKGQFNVQVRGFDSPALEAKSVSCPARREVIVSLGSLPLVDTQKKNGVFEPGARVDNTVQMALNSAVSLEILRANEKVKDQFKCEGVQNSDGYGLERRQCYWKQLQATMTALGIKEDDVACRAVTVALADQVIGRAQTPALRDEMAKMVKDPAYAQSQVKSFLTQVSNGDANQAALTKCESSAMLHLAVPTGDMFEMPILNSLAPCQAKTLLGDRVPLDNEYAYALRDVYDYAVQLKAHPDDVAFQKGYASAKLKAETKFPKMPGIQSLDDFTIYENARRPEYARRNISYNCVHPDPAVMAIGYEVSQQKDVFFQDPQKLGKNTDVKYSSATFAHEFNSKFHEHGFGCAVCGSGLDFHDGKLEYANGLVDLKSGGVDMRTLYGKDGMNLIKAKNGATAASFLAPATYEIPNCAHCDCVKNGSLKEMIAAAIAKGPISRSVDFDDSSSHTLGSSEISQSCLFTPAVAHACPVGPSGKSEQARALACQQAHLRYIDRTMHVANASVVGGLLQGLNAVSGGSCPVNTKNSETPSLQSYQKMVDSVVCEQRKPPVRLPTAELGSELKDCAK